MNSYGLIVKAVISTGLGKPDVLEIKEIDKPILQNDEVLIKTYCTSINTIDIVYRGGITAMFGLTHLMTGFKTPKKKVLGFDISGEVIDVSPNVTDFKTGDRVYGGARSGANAELARAGVTKIAKMSSSMTYTQAGVMPVAALTALQGLRDQGNIHEGLDVLIYGASGGTGTFAVQIAKIYGAKITGVASGKNKALIKELGADIFVDYTKEDFTKRNEKYDIILDAVGKIPPSKWKKSLKEDGIFVNVGSPSMSIIRMFLAKQGNRFRSQQYRTFETTYSKPDLELLAQFCEEGKLKSVIDKSFMLENLVEAHQYYEKGHTAGKIAIIVQKESS